MNAFRPELRLPSSNDHFFRGGARRVMPTAGSEHSCSCPGPTADAGGRQELAVHLTAGSPALAQDWFP